MVYPWLKLSAKIVHEQDSLPCRDRGIYSLVFCNRHSWLQSRTVDLRVEIVDANGTAKQIPVAKL